MVIIRVTNTICTAKRIMIMNITTNKKTVPTVTTKAITASVPSQQTVMGYSNMVLSVS